MSRRNPISAARSAGAQGDLITLDVAARTINLDVPSELANAASNESPTRFERGYGDVYQAHQAGQ